MGKELFQGRHAPGRAGGESGNIRQAILLVLLVLTVGFGYIYFFTGLIKPREHVEATPPQAMAPIKQPLPPRPTLESGDEAPAAPDAGLNEPLPAPPEQSATPQPEPKGPAVPAAGPAPKPASATAPKGDAAPLRKPAAGSAAKGAAAQAPKPAATQAPKAIAAKAPKPATNAAAKSASQPAPKPAAATTAKAPPKPAPKAVASTAPKQTTQKAPKPAAEIIRKAPAGVAKTGDKRGEEVATKKGYALLIGELASAGEAENVRGRLRKLGIGNSSVKTIRNSETMHRLSLGEFNDSGTANAELARLKPHCGSAFILRENGRYALYAGSYLRGSRAVAEGKRLEEKGFRPSVKEAKVVVPVYQVVAGSFASDGEARSEAEKLKKSGINAGVVKLGL